MKIFRGINQILDLGFSPEGTERKELMVEHTVSFSFERSVYIKLEKGDSITHNGKLFYLKDDYIPTVNKSTNGFVYDLKFYDIMERMKDIKLKYNGETDFKLTVTGGQFLDVVVSSFLGITKGSFPTDIKEIHFENVSVFDALNLITETYDTEWWLSGSTLNLSKCEFGAPVILRLDTELEDISVSQSSETLVTRLYAKGSTRNIPKGYSQDNRLKLATGYIDLIPDLPESKIIEGVHIFEDIYPRQTTSIVEVIQGSVGDTPIFTIRGNNAFTITQNDVIPGQPLKIAFNTGNLAGREFELIIRADNKFEIKYIQDGELVIPNLTLKPAIGDEFFFFNFNAESVLPTLIAQAENELLVAAQDYLDNLGSQLVYDCETRSIYCEQNVIDLVIGQVVTIQSENIGSVTTRIRAYEKQLLNSFECKYQAGDYSKYSRLKMIEKAANAVNDGAVDATLAATSSLLKDLQDQIDGKVETHFTDTDPATEWTTADFKTKHTGDMWFNSTTKKLQRYSGSEWVLIEDQKAIDAFNIASTAKDTADGKRRVFTSTPTVPYDVGDLWAQGTSGDLMRCATAKTSAQSYNVADWVKASKYTDDTVAEGKNATFFAKPANYKRGDTWFLTKDETVNGIFYRKGTMLHAAYATGQESDWRQVIYEPDATSGVNILRNYDLRFPDFAFWGDYGSTVDVDETLLPTSFYKTGFNILADEYGFNYPILDENGNEIVM